jgi:hypothetical protein
MGRTILLVLALVVLIAIGLVWMGVINLQPTADGGVRATVNPVEMTTETRTVNVQVPVVRTVPENGAQPQ